MKMYQIICVDLLVVTFKANNLSEALNKAQEEGLKPVSVTEFKA